MRFRRIGLLITSSAVALISWELLRSQELPVITSAPVEAAAATPEVQKGVEVQARGPIHEAFATPTAEAKPTYGVPKKPPEEIEEMPPDEKPEGDAIWIGGYWAWDDDRADFLWVSGCWRIRPDGKQWVAGYWREVSGQHQWVPGFWNTVQERQAQEVTYYPEPPPPPQAAPPPPPPEPDMFYVPGHWMWVGDHYVWRAGYHTRIRAGYVYVPSHYRWTPYGHVFVAGYWDYTIGRRGVLYAPVVVDTVVVGPRFVFTPYYAVSDTVIVDAYFVRPGFCHYYFGDYYGPRYTSIGFECGYHYSHRHYDAVVVYNRWEHRHTPGWHDTHISITVARHAGRAPVPPRTLIQQNNVTVINRTTNVYNKTVLAPTKTVVAARGAKTVQVDTAARMQVKQSAVAMQRTAIAERSKTELAPQGRSAPAKPRTAALNVQAPPAQPGPKAGNTAGAATRLEGPKNSAGVKATSLPKKADRPGPPDGPPLATKTPPPGSAGKLKSADGPPTAKPPPGGIRPAVSRPPPERPAPQKKSSEEGKKKGG